MHDKDDLPANTMPRFCSHLTEQVDIFCKNVDNIMIFATHDMLY